MKIKGMTVQRLTSILQTYCHEGGSLDEVEIYDKEGNRVCSIEEMYSERVKRLCKVMATLNADIYVFEEIENEAVIQDICNGLSAHKWNSTGIWNYACFSKEPESSIGCAVISKYELRDLSNHSIEAGSPKLLQPALRAIGKVKVKIGNKDFVLFVNHWKSKSSGEIETEIWRIKQESILTNLVCETVEENQNYPILIYTFITNTFKIYFGL